MRENTDQNDSEFGHFSRSVIFAEKINFSNNTATNQSFQLNIYLVNVLNPQFPVDLFRYTKELFNGKLYFLCKAMGKLPAQISVLSQRLMNKMLDQTF